MGPARRADLIKYLFRTHSLILRNGMISASVPDGADMQSLHPRYPVLKVPAPARLAAAVAQGLIMPEGGPAGGVNLRLHILYTYLDRRDRPVS